MKEFEEKFNKLVEENFCDPTEDFFATQYDLFIKTGKCLLSDIQIEILADDDIRYGDLASAYGISATEASRVYEYIEEFGSFDAEKENQ